MKYFIANWKANKNLKECQTWINEFLKYKIKNEVSIIICPPYPFILPLKKMLEGNSLISVGAQNISVFEKGTYTGEVTAYSLESIASYVIIGHSERIKYFNESETDIKRKYLLAKKYNIEPIYCIANINFSYPFDVKFLCYEPPDAISKGDGEGNSVSLQNILITKQKLQLNNQTKFIYGGSVNKDNAPQYLRSKEIDGLLVGGASLDPYHFYQIISS